MNAKIVPIKIMNIKMKIIKYRIELIENRLLISLVYRKEKAYASLPLLFHKFLIYFLYKSIFLHRSSLDD